MRAIETAEEIVKSFRIFSMFSGSWDYLLVAHFLLFLHERNVVPFLLPFAGGAQPHPGETLCFLARLS